MRGMGYSCFVVLVFVSRCCAMCYMHGEGLLLLHLHCCTIRYCARYVLCVLTRFVVRSTFVAILPSDNVFARAVVASYLVLRLLHCILHTVPLTGISICVAACNSSCVNCTVLFGECRVTTYYCRAWILSTSVEVEGVLGSLLSVGCILHHYSSHCVQYLPRCIGQSVKCRVYLQCVCSCLLYTSPSPRDLSTSRMPSSA